MPQVPVPRALHNAVQIAMLRFPPQNIDGLVRLGHEK